MTTSIVVKNVYNGGKAYHFDDISLDTLVAELKQRLCDEVDEHPIPAQQRLIYSGGLAQDHGGLAQDQVDAEVPQEGLGVQCDRGRVFHHPVLEGLNRVVRERYHL